MKYYKLTDRLNFNEIVKDDDGKRYTYRFGAEKWIPSGIMTRYMWPDDKKFGQYVEVTEDEANQIIDEQRKNLNSFIDISFKATENAHMSLISEYGEEYERYYKTIMDSLNCTEHEIVWRLYDVIERKLFSLEDLDSLDISYRIINSVQILIKPADITEKDYLMSVKKDNNAWHIKKAELSYIIENHEELKQLGIIKLAFEVYKSEREEIMN